MFGLMHVSVHQAEHPRQRASLRCQHLFSRLIQPNHGAFLLWPIESCYSGSSHPPRRLPHHRHRKLRLRGVLLASSRVCVGFRSQLAILDAAFLTHAHAAEADRNTPSFPYFVQHSITCIDRTSATHFPAMFFRRKSVEYVAADSMRFSKPNFGSGSTEPPARAASSATC
jgi:hypothetical protein